MATKEEIIESIASMSVMDVADLIKMMEEKFGVVAAAAVAAGPAAAGEAAPAEEEQTEFTVVENGGTLKEGVSKEEAASMKEKLTAAGCEIEVK